MQNSRIQNNNQYISGLYRFVFLSAYVKFAISFLFIAFLVQPVAPVFANEIVESEIAVIEVVESEIEPESDPVEESVPDDLVEEVVVEPEAEDVVGDFIDEEVIESDPVQTTVYESDPEGDVLNDDVTPINNEEEVSEGAEEVETIDFQDETVSTPGDQAAAASTEYLVSETASSTPDGSEFDDVATSSETIVTEEDEESFGTEEPAEDDEVASSSLQATTAPETEISSSTDLVEMDVSVSTEGEENLMEDEILNNEEVIDEPEISNENVSESSTATSSTESDNEIATSAHYSDSNKYQFSESQCVDVGDGSYYCSASDTDNQILPEDDLYTEIDSDGDREIYMRIGGEVLKITDNTYEDNAPYYDAVSESVVWHRLVDGRYEILSYSLEDKKEVVITQNNVNDMEPSRAGKYTVWQKWVSDNWEIVLFDGEEELQITDNSYHDVAAHIRGGYVIWHTNNNDGTREVSVYEIETGLTSTIADEDGGVVENPRFVLVYDTKFENGDVVTKGYDLESGEVVPLSALPGELPAEIPEPDTTGETRALIQNKSTTNEEEVVHVEPTNTEDDPDETSTEDTLIVDVSLATSTESEMNASSTINMLENEEEPLQLTEFDIVLEPYIASSSAQEVDSASTTDNVE